MKPLKNKPLKRILAAMLVVVMLVSSGVVNADDLSQAIVRELSSETDNVVETNEDNSVDTSEDNSVETSEVAGEGATSEITEEETVESEDVDDEKTNEEVVDSESTEEIQSSENSENDTEEVSNEEVILSEAETDTDDKVNAVQIENVTSEAIVVDTEVTNGLPTVGRGIVRPSDDAYAESADFVAKLSNCYNVNTSSYASYKCDVVAQIYTYTIDSNGNGKWVEKKEDGKQYKWVIESDDLPYVSSGNYRIPSEGATVEFSLEPGELCFFYPAVVGTGKNEKPTVKTGLRTYWFSLWIGLTSTEEYDISEINDKRTSSALGELRDSCWYDRYLKNLNVEKVEIAPQEQYDWSQTQENGLPSAGLQIQYDVADDIEFAEYSNIFLETTLWKNRDNIYYVQYNGESNLGAKTSTGYNPNLREILYRVELYKKGSDGKYTKDRDLLEHLYVTSDQDEAMLLNNFKDKLDDTEVQEILRDGGVICIVPLSREGYTYEQLTATEALANSKNASVFGFDYIFEFLGKSDQYTVAVSQALGAVGNIKDTNGDGEALQSITIKVSKDASVEQGLVISGEGIPEGITEHLYIQLDPKVGATYEGRTALRFLARVYKDNGDGTYTAKEITSGTHYSNWDFVQRDTESQNQKGQNGNFSWQDNRYLECELSSDEIVVIYPIEWDESKNNWQWYPYSEYQDAGDARCLLAFSEINKPNYSAWSFSYKIGVRDTSDNLLIGGTYDNGAELSVKNGVLSSKKNVTTGNQQIVKLNLVTSNDVERLNSQGNPAVVDSVDGGLVVRFEGLNDIESLSYDEFRKNMTIYLKTKRNGMNTACMDGILADDAMYFNAIFFDKDGNWYTKKNYPGNTNYIGNEKWYQFAVDDMTEAEFNCLKEGGCMVIYPQVRMTYGYVNARFYSFDYGFACRTDEEKFVVAGITDQTSEGTVALETDELGIYNGSQTLSYNGVRKSEVTISIAENANAEDKASLDIRSEEEEGYGLPDHGIIFTVEEKNSKGCNSSNYLDFDIEITAPREKKNGETRLEESHVDVALLHYIKSNGHYVCNDVKTSTLTATYPGSGSYTGRIFGTYFSNTHTYQGVYVLIPIQKTITWDSSISAYSVTKDNLVEEFEFDVKLTGLRSGNFSITSVQENTNPIDPLSYDYSAEAGWSDAITGTGTFGDRYDLGTISSEDGKTRLLNLKLNVEYRTSGIAQQGLSNVNTWVANGAALAEGSTALNNMVIIRNDAQDYEADQGTANAVNSSLSADDMPDVQVAITASSQKGENVAINWRKSPSIAGSDVLQLPYQAFLYNYDNGTYTKINLSSYYSFDTTDNPISGPAGTQWGAAPGATSYFHTHLADNQAIIIVPTANYYNFSYQVSIKNNTQYKVTDFNCSKGYFTQKRENLYQSGAITNIDGIAYSTKFQEVILSTSKVTVESEEEKTVNRLSESLPEGQYMSELAVTLFDYDFPGLTATDFSGQSSNYKFLLDPLNNYDYSWNHIGDNKTLAYGGILQDSLSEDNLPVFNYSTPFNLFSQEEVTEVTNGGTKKVYPAQFEFVYDESTGTYSYNSHLHHAQMEITETDGAVDSEYYVRQYDKGLGLENWGNQSAGFFPYNTWADTTGYWGTKSNDNADTYLVEQEDLNYHFGMSMTQSYTIPLDGKIKGNDMVFSISGDDDIWMFIDGKLVLDIGGIHEAIKGEINFTQGTYTINGVVSQLSDILTDYSVENFGSKEGAWAFGTEHTFEFFYLERGGTLSNMDISFNMPILQTTTIDKSVISDVESDKSADYKFKVSLYTDAAGTTPYTGVLYLIDEAGNKTKQSLTEQGTFELTVSTDGGAGAISFLTQEECKAYSVEEIENDTYTTSKFFIIWNAIVEEETRDADGVVEQVKKNVEISQGEVIDISNPLTCINTRRTGNLTVSKTVEGEGGETDKNFNFTVTLVDTKLNGTYGDMEFVDGVATFTLKHGESKTATGLPAEVSYTVTEKEANKSGYKTTAEHAEGTIVADQTVVAAFLNHRDKFSVEFFPFVGGIGTTIFYVTGAALMLGAVVLLALKKRRSMR